MRKTFLFKSGSNGLSSNPGKSWFFVFKKNSLRKRELKLVIVDPVEWIPAFVDSKITSSSLTGSLYDEIPANPLIHPVKAVLAIPV